MAAMPECPVAAVLAAGAVDLGEAELGRMAAELAVPVRVSVSGRAGAGRTTVTRAVRAAGLELCAGLEVREGGAAEVAVYVFVERLTPEDRRALSAIPKPCVAVFNKADLAGFDGPGPMVSASQRCRLIQRDVGMPTVAIAGLAAAAAFDRVLLDGKLLDALVTLVSDPARLTPKVRERLPAELDLFGVATAVTALRADRDVHDALRRACGVELLLAEIARAAAAVRYRRAVAAVTSLAGPAARSAAIAGFLSGDALAFARMAAATAVVEADGLGRGFGRTKEEHLRAAIWWQRYARGPVTDLHRRCATDIARGALRRWAA